MIQPATYCHQRNGRTLQNDHNLFILSKSQKHLKNASSCLKPCHIVFVFPPSLSREIQISPTPKRSGLVLDNGSVTVNLSFLDCICSLELPHKVINQTKPPVNDATRTSASNTKNLMRVDGIGQIQMTSIIHQNEGDFTFNAVVNPTGLSERPSSRIIRIRVLHEQCFEDICIAE